MKIKKRFIFVFFIVLSAISITLYFTIKRMKAEQSIVSGIVQAGEINFGSRQSGRIKKIFVHEGDFLKQGQLILELENDELINQEDAMLAQISAQKAYLKELKTGNRQEDIEASKDSFDLTKAQLNRANEYLNRRKALFKEKIITKDQLEEAEKDFIVAKKTYEKAEQEYKKIKTGTRIEKLESESAMLEKYNAQLKELNNKVSELSVISPCNCELGEFTIKAGNLILANQVLGTLIDLDDVWVTAYLPEELYGVVKIQDKVKITSFSYPNKVFSGRVSFIGLESEFTPRNIQTIEGRKQQVFKVRVDLDNSERIFRPGMDLNLNFNVKK